MSAGVCKYFQNCGFFERYSSEINRKDKTTLFQQYIRIYCFGILQQNCYRLQQKDLGNTPPDDITPTGVKYTQEQ